MLVVRGVLVVDYGPVWVVVVGLLVGVRLGEAAQNLAVAVYQVLQCGVLVYLGGVERPVVQGVGQGVLDVLGEDPGP